MQAINFHFITVISKCKEPNSLGLLTSHGHCVLIILQLV